MNKINTSILSLRRDDQLPLIWLSLFPLRSHDSVQLLNISPSHQPQTSCEENNTVVENLRQQHCASLNVQRDTQVGGVVAAAARSGSAGFSARYEM